MRWNELHAVMMESLPSDLSQWTEDNWKMVSVFTTKPIEELRRLVSIATQMG